MKKRRRFNCKFKFKFKTATVNFIYYENLI